ncbi:putative membrane protein [Yersinia pestis PY-13]|nr:putative membrane protein [Yersinia pestis PY-07]EIR38575.1 putative membrane protein [Yersinia pestis PY-10]EIR51944.1 putative membrane protein [Yersinia pestis PY-13]EIR55894.1 putative membrane protein [Yersinia pestis PY-14]EIR66062.1 putative membrane protein [Yersinia pestis PY-16]EIR95445.1 putative membrane protein [Yersinia pestis PY-36]EIS11014.1 putative membrane protein [Yersinia pestis PY-47]EIS48661.1 putative membrane protein [Yersinia pestis PY-60]EIT21554.1 putative mem
MAVNAKTGDTALLIIRRLMATQSLLSLFFFLAAAITA